MLKVTLISVTGREYLLTGSQVSSPVLAPLGALESLVGKSTRTDSSVPGRAGVIAGVPRYGAIEEEVGFFLHADDGELMEALYREFRQGWQMWSPGAKPSVLKVEADRSGGPYFLDVWLGKRLPGVQVDMRTQTSAVLPVTLFSPVGLYRSEVRTGGGAVRIVNDGDAPIYPVLRWSGAGGVVTAPSGARFTLPASGVEQTIDSDPRLLRADGVFPEAVPAGGEGTWIVPAGVRVEWSVLVADPWA